jgi:hypothetical protein
LNCFERARLQAVPQVPQINVGFSRWGKGGFETEPLPMALEGNTVSNCAQFSRGSMDLSVQAQIETYLTHLGNLIRRGRELIAAMETDPQNGAPIVSIRAWQEDCGVTINQLSGGSKAHWLARSFSQAFLLRSAAGIAVDGAPPAEIVQRLIDVLEQAVATLSGMDGSNGSAAALSQAPPPHRFDFVHNPELRPVLEEAYADCRRALEQADYDMALRTTCGILEAIVTDALEHHGLTALAATGAPAGKIADWSFNTRLAVAERAGLIRGGCARLPSIARSYRDHADSDPGKTESESIVSEREARTAGQVLHVIIRDLDPGR